MAVLPWQRSRVLPARKEGIWLGAIANSSEEPTLRRFAFQSESLSVVTYGRLGAVPSHAGVDGLVRSGNYAEALGLAYREFGAEFAAHVEGQYAVLLHDGAADRLVAATSRDGFAPLYLARQGEIRLFGSLLGPLAAVGLAHPELDAEAVATFLAYGQVMGRQTIVAGVRALDPATSLIVDLAAGCARGRRYWDFSAVPERRDDWSLERHVDDVCGLVIAATERMMQRPGRYVAGLSGGLDSRLVAGMAARHRADLKAWTFGDPGAADLRVAQQVCARLGLEHLIFPPRPQAVPETADLFTTTVDGSVSCTYAFSLLRCRELREHADVVLNGYGGDAILGDTLLGPKAANVKAWLRYKAGRGPRVAHPRLEDNRSAEDIARYVESIYGKPSRLTELLSSPPPPLWQTVLQSCQAELAAVPPEYRAEQWIHQNRGRRWTMMGIVSDRHFFDDGCLFYDYELIDRCFAIPPRWRRGRRVYSQVLQRLLPQLAEIDYGNTGMPAATPAWRLTAGKIARRLSARLRGRQPHFIPTTGTDFNGWARTVLRDFYGDLAASASFLSRSYWDGRAVRALFESHMRGEVQAGSELGLAATIELFSRRWIDRASSQIERAR